MITEFEQYLKIPKLIPFKFNEVSSQFWNEQQNELEPLNEAYCQKVQTSDVLTFQLIIKKTLLNLQAGRYIIELVDKYENVIFVFNKIELYTDDDDWTYTHFHKVLSYTGYDFPEGKYFIRAKFFKTKVTGQIVTVQTETLYSEPLDIQNVHENTVYLQYKHSEFDFDMLHKNLNFGNPSVSFSPLYNFRVEGGVWSKNIVPTAESIVYFSQKRSAKVISAIPYTLVTFTFGNPKGLPNWVAEKINRIFCTEFVRIENIYYSKNEGAELEQVEYPEYTARGVWELQCLRYENKYIEDFRKHQKGFGSGNVIIGNGLILI